MNPISLQGLQGCNKDEGNYYLFSIGGVEPGVELCNSIMARKKLEMTEEEKSLIDSFCNDIKGEDYEHATRIIEHLWYTVPLITLSENQAMSGGKSYTYLFTVESAYPLMKCGHAVELSTLFNHPEITEFSGRSSMTRQPSKQKR